MKTKTIELIKKVSFTTLLSYFLMSVFFIGIIALFDDTDPAGADFGRSVAFRYMFGKLSCIFGFSLSLGFLNRLTETKKNHALMRLLHFVLCLISFVIFMIVCFLGLFELDSLNIRSALGNLVLYVVFYFVVLGISSIGKALAKPKSDKSYESIVK